MAQFCARVRKRADLPSVSMKDIYQHPTIKDLAAAFAEPAPAPLPLPETVPPAISTNPRPASTAAQHSRRRRHPGPAPLQYVLCGTLQLLIFLGYTTVSPWLIVAEGFLWVAGQHQPARHLPAVARLRRRDASSASPPADRGQMGSHRSLEASADPHLESGVLPLLARQDADPSEPAGSVRGRVAAVCALSEGAGSSRSGSGVTILSRAIPVCTDLLTIGDGTVIRKGASLSCYRAHAGRDRDRPGHAGPGRSDQRGHRARHRDLDGRRGPARAFLVAAPRAVGAGRRALARVPGAADRDRLPVGRTDRLRNPETGPLPPRAGPDRAAGDAASGDRRRRPPAPERPPDPGPAGRGRI